MKVKLHPNLVKAGMGFIDPAGQRINARKAEKDGTISVKDTEFVREKINSGELIAVADQSEAVKTADKDKK